MRLLTLMAIGLLPFAAHALTITGFSGQYDAPNGQGSATQFDLPSLESEAIEILVEGRGEGYVLTTPDGQWEWENPSAWVKGLKSAQWSNVDVVLGDSSQRAAIGSLQGVHEDKSVNVQSLSASCSGAADLIESCLNGQGSIRLGAVNYVSALRQDTYRDVLQALARALEVPARASELSVQNLKLDVANKKFKGEVSIKASISATVKFEGLISYSTEDKKIAIRLDKAKALFLDVRGKIFDELEKVQSESLEVRRPWIYITLD